MIQNSLFHWLLSGLAVVCLCCVLAAPANAAKASDAPPKVVATPQPDSKQGQAVVNGVEVDSPEMNPKAAAIEERVMRYKFILESLGFTLEEIVFSPDLDYGVELTFKGRLNATLEKIEELAEKFKDEEKLMNMMRTVFAYNNRDLTNYGAYMVVLQLSEPVGVKVHYRKF